MFFTSPAEQLQLRKETEEINKRLMNGIEVERVDAVRGIEQANQQTDVEEQAFQDFHRRREVIRIEDRFLASHKNFVNTGNNHLAIAKWLGERNLTERDVT